MKKNECANRFVCLFFSVAGAEELTGLRQVSVRLEADQRLRHRSGVETQVLIMLAVLLANTVFYKAKKRLLTRNDADGRRFIICYIHHQDGQKH